MTTATATPPQAAPHARVHRFEVRPRPDELDPRAQRLRAEAAAIEPALTAVRVARVYLIECPPLADPEADRLAQSLLASPVTETVALAATPAPAGWSIIEVHPLPGVMDPAAASVADAARVLLPTLAAHPGAVRVSTAWRYEFQALTPAQARRIAERLLANPVVHAIHAEPYAPATLPSAATPEFRLTHVPIRDLDDAGLEKLSREAHLFLDLHEMRAIQAEYQRLNREPTDIELETLAQTWSEHCVHKTLKATIRYQPDSASAGFRLPGLDDASRPRPGHEPQPDGSVIIRNLLKSTVAAATHELIAEGCDWTLSVFVDNAGIVRFNDDHAVCIKVETHNHPSAIEPYGGAATGIGGCIRDIMGTGLAAKPIASTDVFCVAHPDSFVTTTDTLELAYEVVQQSPPVLRGRIGDLPFLFQVLDQWIYEVRVAANPQTNPLDVDTSDWSTGFVNGSTYLSGEDARLMSTAEAEQLLRHQIRDLHHLVKSYCTPAKGEPYAENEPYRHFVQELPAGCIPPRRVLEQVVAGVRDYGNRMGIPTVNGAVAFDDRYVGNPLVFCGCVGLMPADKIEGHANPGDLIVALGGRTGRDGIHGATFSSAELTDTHADEFAHAVQIGNAIEEKRTLDAILRARDYVADEAPGAGHQAPVQNIEPDADRNNRCPVPGSRCLYTAITDCGAGGFSSAVGEMGEKIGADVHLERAPLKYAGLTYTEIWISEAQERMVLAVPPENLDALQKICDEEHVELAVLGTFGTPGADLILNYMGHEVGRLPMAFLHDGIPTPTREAAWTAPETPDTTADNMRTPSAGDALLALLAHPDIASKHWIIRQYDHEVQGRTVLKPLVGPQTRGPGDAAVLEPVPGTNRGIAIASGLATPVGDPDRAGDPYHMALCAIDECVRNLVCVGADPARTAILDNFCWPSCKKPQNLASLVRAAEGCYDAAKAYRTPFVSGKDSLNNQFTTNDGRTIEIPPTLLITGLSIVPDLRRVVTMDAKRPGNLLMLITPPAEPTLGASRYADLFAVDRAHSAIPTVNLKLGPAAAACVATLIEGGLVRSAHDVSDGGLLCAIAEMLIAGSTEADPIGAQLTNAFTAAELFSEAPSRYLLEIEPAHAETIAARARAAGLRADHVATLDASARLRSEPHALDLPVAALTSAWLATLDW